MYIQRDIDMYIYIYTHMHIHIYIYTHTHLLVLPSRRPSWTSATAPAVSLLICVYTKDVNILYLYNICTIDFI